MTKNIMFDLDGTIVDTSEGIVKSMNYALNKIGCDEKDAIVIKNIIGPPLIEMVEILLEEKDYDKIEICVDYFRERYSKEGLIELEPYDGIIELLKSLKEKNHNLYIVTSKPTVYAKKILEEYGILNLFSGISGVELKGKSLSKSERLINLIIENKFEADNCIMIGDRPEDVIAANESKIKSIGVEYGFGKRDKLIDANATYVVINVKELSSMLLK